MRCLKPFDDLTRSDDGDALMGTDKQQVFAVASDNAWRAYGAPAWRSQA